MMSRGISHKLMVIAAALTAAAVAGTPGGAVAAPPARQVLFYNHSWATVDRATADAIEHSAYLREFSDLRVRTTTGGGRTWTGRYLLGRETYLEFFGTGDLAGQDGLLGAAGLGVSTERAGDLDTVAARLPDPTEFTQTRDFGDGVPVPWFDAIVTFDTYDAFGAWGMEYRPAYLADPRSNAEPASFPGDVGRERALPDDYRDRLARDVTEVHLAVTASDLAATLPLLRAGGFTVRRTPSGAIASGGGTTLRFDTVPRDQAGLRRAELTLNHPVPYRHIEPIGTSELVVGPGSHAVWTFGGP